MRLIRECLEILYGYLKIRCKYLHSFNVSRLFCNEIWRILFEISKTCFKLVSQSVITCHQAPLPLPQQKIWEKRGGGGLGGRADALVNEPTFCLPRQKVRVKVEIVAKTIPLDNSFFFLIFLAINQRQNHFPVCRQRIPLYQQELLRIFLSLKVCKLHTVKSCLSAPRL